MLYTVNCVDVSDLYFENVSNALRIESVVWVILPVKEIHRTLN